MLITGWNRTADEFLFKLDFSGRMDRRRFKIMLQELIFWAGTKGVDAKEIYVEVRRGDDILIEGLTQLFISGSREWLNITLFRACDCTPERCCYWYNRQIDMAS